jgi:outer membrane protein TolC
MRLAILAANLLLALLASGCAIAPQPAPGSTVQIPAGWRTRVGPSAAVEARWWKAFDDPALNALVDLALTRNVDLRMAGARVKEYQARVRIAAGGQTPLVTAGFTPVRERELDPFGVPIDVTAYRGNLQASYEVDLWGRLESLSDAARADYQGQQAAADGAALSVAATAA